jgi:hypothetical protein
MRKLRILGAVVAASTLPLCAIAQTVDSVATRILASVLPQSAAKFLVLGRPLESCISRSSGCRVELVRTPDIFTFDRASGKGSLKWFT